MCVISFPFVLVRNEQGGPKNFIRVWWKNFLQKLFLNYIVHIFFRIVFFFSFLFPAIITIRECSSIRGTVWSIMDWFNFSKVKEIKRIIFVQLFLASTGAQGLAMSVSNHLKLQANMKLTWRLQYFVLFKINI